MLILANEELESKGLELKFCVDCFWCLGIKINSRLEPKRIWIQWLIVDDDFDNELENDFDLESMTSMNVCVCE